jgi:large subunit ribosomal protein L17
MLKVLYTVKEVPTTAAGRKKNTKTVDLTDKLFNEYAPKYADRKGGYTRIIKIGQRKGDAAMEVVLELV